MSFFKYTDRYLFLKRFLNELGLTVTGVDCENADFQFWPIYVDKTEPDLVILVGQYYLLIEAKYFSDFGKEQGKTKAQLVSVRVPAGLLPNFHWINWQKLTQMISVILDNPISLNDGTRLMTEDLYVLLVRKVTSCLCCVTNRLAVGSASFERKYSPCVRAQLTVRGISLDG